MNKTKTYKLTDKNGEQFFSFEKGLLGGNSNMKIYGRMDCRSANACLRGRYREAYIRHRVFFQDEETAIAAGYRPCGVCMKEHYALWKEGKIIPGNVEETKNRVDFL